MNIPFNRLSGFVGRRDELKRLQRQIFDHTGSQIVSILGLGGEGKSRLALELSHQIHSDYPEWSILWAEATDQLTFERDMFEIGKKLAIPGITDEKADVKSLVRSEE